jgi:hypothetical protein
LNSVLILWSWQGCIGRVEHLLGVNFYEAEEISQGEKHLMAAQDLLADHHIEHMDCLNHLAMIWSTRSEYARAEGFLQRAQELHAEFVAQADEASCALSSPPQKQYTATLFLMAQVYPAPAAAPRLRPAAAPRLRPAAAPRLRPAAARHLRAPSDRI